MQTLWLTKVHPANRLRSLRAVRDALNALGGDDVASAAEAAAILRTFAEDGFAYLGDGNADALEAARSALAAQMCEGTINLDPEVEAKRQAARRMTREGATPEQVFAEHAPGQPAQPQAAVELSPKVYRTAIGIMAGANGNPLTAAAQANTLARTTEDAAFYWQVIGALCETFPWLPNIMQQQGIVR